MKHSVPHNLEPKRAKEMLDQMLETYCAHYDQYGITADWRDNETADVGMNIQGREVRGCIKIAPDRFDLDFDVPWLFLPFKPKIKKTLDEEAQRWLANF